MEDNEKTEIQNEKSIDYAFNSTGKEELIVETAKPWGEERLRISEAYIECRKKLNLTQQNLADASGIARANVARFENGTYNPTLDTMRRLADAMGMKLEIRLVEKEKKSDESGT